MTKIPTRSVRRKGTITPAVRNRAAKQAARLFLADIELPTAALAGITKALLAVSDGIERAMKTGASHRLTVTIFPIGRISVGQIERVAHIAAKRGERET